MKFTIVLILTSGIGFSSSSALPFLNRTHRIVGGVEATPHEIPSILNSGQNSCGATLIHPQWALTAAHCIVTWNPMDELVAGDHIVNKDEGTEQIIRVVQTFKHPEYQHPGGNSNDAALLKLEKPFELNKYVQIAQLPPRNFQPSGDALVAGWGSMSEGGPSPKELHKVTVPLVSDKACKEAYSGYGNLIDDSMICAGIAGKDSCQGDSGGPLFCNSPNGKVHCGIVSFGEGCGRPGKPGVYARTSEFLDWIQQTTGIPL